MPRRAAIVVSPALGGQYQGAGTNYLIQTPTGVLYCVFVDPNQDVSFKKSTNNGLTWSAATVISGALTVTHLSVWYDRWSGISAGLIHCAFAESAADDTSYRTINTESSDALSTLTVIFAGASTLAGGHLSITRARGGNVYCKTVIDAGTEGGFYRLPNANVPSGAWDAARTVDEAIATTDQMILVPGFAADNQDIMAIFYDNSATEISRKIYDDSANSWAEASIATSMTLGAAATSHPHFAAAVDLTNSRILLVAWSAVDALNADLRCWYFTESAITEVTNVVQNSTDDQGLAGIGLATDTGYWYVYYAGKSDGSETFNTSLNVYYKVSKDTGSTWGAETKLNTCNQGIKEWLYACPRFTGPFVMLHGDSGGLRNMYCSVDVTQPVARSMIGV
jgi:hypothetical protein